MPAITQGYKLVQALKGTGTGVDKIKVCQAVLVANRQATSADVVAALEADITVSVVTIDKAKQLAATGKYDPAVGQKAAMSIEDQIAEEEARGGSIEPEPSAPVKNQAPEPFKPEPVKKLESNTVEPKKVDGSDVSPLPVSPANKVEPVKVNNASALPS